MFLLDNLHLLPFSSSSVFARTTLQCYLVIWQMKNKLIYIVAILWLKKIVLRMKIIHKHRYLRQARKRCMPFLTTIIYDNKD